MRGRSRLLLYYSALRKADRASARTRVSRVVRVQAVGHVALLKHLNARLYAGGGEEIEHRQRIELGHLADDAYIVDQPAHVLGLVAVAAGYCPRSGGGWA